ncbi:lantibiotic ABC transporter [Anoxybacter fermentans]|uniref:Lantibiotic ABC transporter n=1 Tax=Anoxybacter fermentans TaxID=1323375 RepID=A0A3S9SYF2_9FIRM|nr:alanine-tRNA synthetase second additional domain-containing protein [Anoxybacter fermentans]AZR73386.1 lantibiotic ABC transporter [Anoxybacter fermentans]
MIAGFAHSTYFAPRGKERLMFLGHSLSQRYLHPNDHLIGLIGVAGAGKSLLIRGMFPGLTLTNDDEGINIRPLPLLEDYQKGKFQSHTYHVDARFEAAFTQPWKLAEAVQKAVIKNKRVVVEHFDLLESHLNINPDLLIGIGEEVLVTRPGVFGPTAKEIAQIVFKSIDLRRMSHTAEDLTSMVIEDMGYERPPFHSDVKSGFVLEFEKKPDFSLDEVERRVLEYIEKDIPVCYLDEEHIKLGDRQYFCTGPRIHVRKTGDIKGFKLIKEFKYNPREKLYLLAGLVGKDEEHSQFKLSKL